MKLPLRFVFVLMAVTAASFLVLAVACGGGEEKEAPTASPTAAAAETPAAGETPAAAEETAEKTPAGEAGELPSIPAYPGAEEVFSGTFTGAEAFPIPMMGEGDIEPEDYGAVKYTMYETSDPPDKVLDFYKKEFKGWVEEWTFSMEELGQNGEVVVWSKDDGNVAAWMSATEDEGTTSVVIAMGAHQ